MHHPGAAGAVVSDEVREKLQQKQKLLEAAEAAAPLSEVQMGQMKGQMAKVMEEGETVMQALKRLGGKQQSVKGRPRPGAPPAPLLATSTHLVPGCPVPAGVHHPVLCAAEMVLCSGGCSCILLQP